MPHPLRILGSDLIPQQHLGASPTLPTPVTGSGQHKLARRVDVDGAEDAAAVARDDSEGDGGSVAVRGRGSCGGREVVDAEDVLACAVRGKESVSKGCGTYEGWVVGTYQTRCLPFGILRTAYTDPEPC